MITRLMGDLMDELEAELAAKAKAAKAEEDALWNALLPAEQDRILAEKAAKFADLMEFDADSEDENEDEEEG